MTLKTAAIVAVFGSVAVALPEVQAETSITDQWVTIVLPSEPPESIDGCQVANQFNGIVSKQNVFETLIARDPEGNLVPRLATEWHQKDPNTWRITLRHGVTFHDGAALDAAAVKNSLERTLSGKIICTDRTKFFNKIDLTMTVVADDTLDISSAKPEPILPTRLAGAGIVSPSTPDDEYDHTPSGTGPYAFDSWRTGQHILLKRFEGYWGDKPEPLGVRYIWREESSVRAAMVKIGEADLAHVIAKQDAVDPDLDHSYQTPETMFMRIDIAVPPLNDQRVRLALNLGFDREAVRGSILPKEVMHATQLVAPFISGHNRALDKAVRSYDPEKAKQLLTEAKADGVPVDRQIILYGRPTGYPNSAEVMEAFEAMYSDIGLNVKVQNLEPGQYVSVNTKPFAEDRAPSLLQSIHDNNSGDAVFTLGSKLSCDGATSAYCDPVFDALVAKGAAETGEDRARTFQEAFRILYEETIPVVWMYHQVGYARISDRINYLPTVQTPNEIHIEDISFK